MILRIEGEHVTKERNENKAKRRRHFQVHDFSSEVEESEG
jgi:hypothetical protein